MSKTRILLVDDDSMVLKGFEAGLRQNGYEVLCSGNAEEAAERVFREKFDLVLSDIQMKGMSGIDLLEQVKASSPDTEVILITGYKSMESAIRALKGGAFDYLVKPCNLDTLRLVIERALEKQQLIKRLIETERLEAILDAARETSSCISGPLSRIRGDLARLSGRSKSFSAAAVESLGIVGREVNRIEDILQRLTELTDLVVTDYGGLTTMIDLNRSKSGTSPSL